MMNNLLQELAAFRDDRGWSKYHTPRNLAEAIVIEAGELLECYLWDAAFPRKSEPRHEIADVLIYALSLCLVLDLDPEAIIREKVAMNAAKYPLPV